MLERLLVLVVVAGLLLLATQLTRAWTRRQTARLAAGPAAPLWQALEREPDGRPTVVSFSTPSCAACHTAQKPALRRLEETLGSRYVRVLQVDAAERPATARAFGVLTVPSTAILDRSGNLITINQGFAPADRLAQQIGIERSN